MNLPLPDGPLLAAFIAASLVLAITPGPAVLYIVTRSITQGRSSGLASVYGVALGNFSNALIAAVGLAAILAVSSAAFMVVKYAGAAYLIYLGVQALRRRPSSTAEQQIPRIALRRVFRDGFLVALLNPKTTLFYAAFLPQFMQPEAASTAGAVTLGALFVAIAAATDTVYALTASAIAPRLSCATGLRRTGRYLSGGVFIGLGVLAAWPRRASSAL